jgi:glutaredoxin
MITVYSKPGCHYCTEAKAWLVLHDIPFVEIDVTEDAAALAFIKGEGHGSVPQLYVGTTLLVKGGYAGLRQLGVEGVKAKIS